jgi:phosphate transport system substrate-binding protein
MRKVFAGLILTGLLNSANAQVVGNGSSFARTLLESWTQSFGAELGGVKYESNGSTAGIEAVSTGTSDFGVTDVPITYAQLTRLTLKQIPLAASAVAVVVNLPKLKGVTVRLNGHLLASIYQGDITHWNHPRLAAINPGLSFPNLAITPIWRKDGSGQSYVLSSYMSRGDAHARRNIGANTKLRFKVGKGVSGGREMLAAVEAINGAIGYDALAGAKKSGLVESALQNSAKEFVLPSNVSINAALSEAQWSTGAAESNIGDLDGSAGAASYPMAAIAYALFSAKVSPPRKSVAAFFEKGIREGDSATVNAGFVPIPEKIKKSIQILQN